MGEQGALRRYIRLTKPVRVEIGDKWAELRPYDGFKIDFEIEFEHPIISQSKQRISLDVTADSFMKQISRARTFGKKNKENKIIKIKIKEKKRQNNKNTDI